MDGEPTDINQKCTKSRGDCTPSELRESGPAHQRMGQVLRSPKLAFAFVYIRARLRVSPQMVMGCLYLFVQAPLR
jgi:hypothetical protein